MFKLLFFLIILGFMLLFILFVYKAIKNAEIIPDLIDKEDGDDIDKYIEGLKSSINTLENKAKIGLEYAEAELVKYKYNLKKAQLFKNKTKNL